MSGFDCKTNFPKPQWRSEQLVSGMMIDPDKSAAESWRQIQRFQFVIFDLSLVSAGSKEIQRRMSNAGIKGHVLTCPSFRAPGDPTEPQSQGVRIRDI